MLIAKVLGFPLRAEPGLTGGACPGCGTPVISKCGDIVAWHWAHERGADCDSWYEPESGWHYGWKMEYLDAGHDVEVYMHSSSGGHRADVRTKAGTVVELQHSKLSTGAISERERFYGRMVWLYDASPFVKRLTMWRRHEERSTVEIDWRRPILSMAAHRAPIFLDIDGTIVHIRAMLSADYDPDDAQPENFGVYAWHLIGSVVATNRADFVALDLERFAPPDQMRDWKPGDNQTKWSTMWTEISSAEAIAREKIWKLPKCSACGFPMCAGQSGTHYSCAPAAETSTQETMERLA